mgnify:CR=1 FL=1
MIREVIKKTIIKTAYFAGILEGMFRLDLGQVVFIVGTGRCGTSLLDRILKSHPDISGFPGEGNDLWHPKLESSTKIQIETMPIEFDSKAYTELSLRNWPINHSKRIKQTFNGFQVITGIKKVFFIKSAMISFMMPQIIKLYPEAKFIHIYRYGPSVVASYFKKNYQKYQNYRPDMEDYYITCARYWNNCILNIEKDRKKLSLDDKNAFFELSYESLCDNTENTLSNLANFLNIQFEEFTYDLSLIRNTNYKVKEVFQDIELKQIIDREMHAAMKQKGYLS